MSASDASDSGASGVMAPFQRCANAGSFRAEDDEPDEVAATIVAAGWRDSSRSSS
jgi:hypothetical protein